MYRLLRKLKKSVELLRKPHDKKYKRISKRKVNQNEKENVNVKTEEEYSIIDILAFAKNNCGLTKNYASVQDLQDELGEEFLREQIDMMKKVKKK